MLEITIYKGTKNNGANSLFGLKVGDKLQDREVEEVQQEQWVDKNGVVSKKHIKKIKKIIPADTTAIIFALKNTDSERWNDRSQVEISGKVGMPNPYADLTTEELRRLANAPDDG